MSDKVCQTCRYRDKKSNMCVNFTCEKCATIVQSFDKCDKWSGEDGRRQED